MKMWWQQGGQWFGYDPANIAASDGMPPPGVSLMTQSGQPIGISNGQGGVMGAPAAAPPAATTGGTSAAANSQTPNNPMTEAVNFPVNFERERYVETPLNVAALNAATTSQGNQLQYQSNQADIAARMQTALLDSQTRERIAQIGDATQRLDMQMRDRLNWAEFYRQMGQDNIANDLSYSAMELQRVKVNLEREAQAYQQGLSTAQFQQNQQQFDRQMGLETAQFQQSQNQFDRQMGLTERQFGADEANRAFQNQMATAAFQQGQQEFDQRNALDRGRFGLDQQGQYANQALQYSNFGLDQQRFALEKQKAEAEMAANPYNAFANAYFVRGKPASAAWAPYGTPGSGWAYGYQDQAEPEPPAVRMPQAPQALPAQPYARSTVQAPYAPSAVSAPYPSMSTPPPSWLTRSGTADSSFSKDFLRFASTFGRR